MFLNCGEWGKVMAFTILIYSSSKKQRQQHNYKAW
jgi:hypothetical protein